MLYGLAVCACYWFSSRKVALHLIVYTQRELAPNSTQSKHEHTNRLRTLMSQAHTYATRTNQPQHMHTVEEVKQRSKKKKKKQINKFQ